MQYPSSGSGQISYRPDIDGLRAIAVLGVFIFHVFPSLLPGGYAGVDVFFAISGYLITSILLEDCRKERFSILRFYGRRIRRILPALLLTIGVTWGLGYALLTPTEFKELARSIVRSSYFANNFLLVSQAGYFDTSAELKPLLHLWSLAVEEQFYIVWPWLILLTWRFAPQKRWLPLTIALPSLAACLILTPIQPVSSFYLPHTRAWELIAGAMVAISGPALRQRLCHTLSAAWLAPLGTLLIAIAYFGFSGNTPYPGWRALFPVVGACLIILGNGEGRFATGLLASRAAVLIGLISYPLYLWHWVFLAYGRILFDQLSTHLALSLAALSLIAAWATYRFVEYPIRHAPKTWDTLIPAACLTVLLVFGGLGDFTRSNEGFTSRIPNNDWQTLLWPDNLLVDPTCRKEIAPEINIGYCRLSHSGPPTHALFGDSHANHFFDGLSEKIQAEGGNLLQLAAPNKPSNDPSWKNLEFLISQQQITTVFIAYHQGRINETDNPFREIFQTLVARLQAAGKHVIAITDNAEFDFDPRLNVARPAFAYRLGASSDLDEKNTASLTQIRRKRARYFAYISDLHQKFPELRFLDALGPFCSHTICQARQNGTLLFRDRHHLTLDGSKELFRRIDLKRDISDSPAL